jgi:hypothetical protein
MLRPKVQKILNEKFRDHSNVCYFGDYNLELTIGLQRLGLVLEAGLVQGTTPSGTSEPVCLGLILQPVTPPPFLCTLCTFILGEVAVGCSHHQVCLAAQDVLGPLYGFS